MGRSRRPLLIEVLLASFGMLLFACSSSAGRVLTPSPTRTPTPIEVTPLPEGLDESQAVAALRARPLRLPLPGEVACPASAARPLPAPVLGEAYGDGPLYLLAGGTGPAVLTFDEQHAVKAIWQLTAASEGPVLIRGSALSGQAALAFDDGAAELVFPKGGAPRGPGAAAGWHELASVIRIAAPGCYGLQMDGPDFSSVIVFEARSDSSPRYDSSPR
ncbi:MAG TPA: hypothetical protein PLX85_07940 [Dehalococcoidia bacterium]|nr:hypothetical protein [Dehalococcoidia bacterium]